MLHLGLCSSSSLPTRHFPDSVLKSRKCAALSSASASPDGYIARPDGSVDFLFMPKDYSMAPFFKTCDVAIMGRKTLEAGLSLGKTDTIAPPGLTCYVSPGLCRRANATAPRSSRSPQNPSSPRSANAKEKTFDTWAEANWRSNS
jgi:hypothetical protein